jgi:hypothetical protein
MGMFTPATRIAVAPPFDHHQTNIPESAGQFRPQSPADTIPDLARSFCGTEKAVADFITRAEVLCVRRDHIVQVLHALDNFRDQFGRCARFLEPIGKAAI